MPDHADMSDAQWARLEPLLPPDSNRGRPPQRVKRLLIDGIRWRTRTGASWRDVPERYGPWVSVYALYRRWQRDGTWQQIRERLAAQADTRDLISWEVHADCRQSRGCERVAGNDGRTVDAPALSICVS